jgi:hypothetical protein
MAQIKGKQIKDNSLDPKKLKTGLIPSSVKLGSEITDFSGEADSTLVTKKFVVDADTAETTARQAADTALQGNINTLTTTVGDNKTAIENSLTAEVTARTNADTTLQGNINTLTTTVGDNKTAIENSLAAEVTARTNADATNLTAAKDYTDSEITANVTNKKGVANGLAPLGADAKIAETFLPDSIVGQVEYMGTYDISGGTEPATAAAANKGHYYIISVAGSRAGFVGNDGDDTEFAIGDWIISDGTKWSKVSNSDAVTTVHGRNGAIVSVAGDYTANQVDFTPANGLASSDVQAAIEEVKDLVDTLDSDVSANALLLNNTVDKTVNMNTANLTIEHTSGSSVQIKESKFDAWTAKAKSFGNGETFTTGSGVTTASISDYLLNANEIAIKTGLHGEIRKSGGNYFYSEANANVINTNVGSAFEVRVMKSEETAPDVWDEYKTSYLFKSDGLYVALSENGIYSAPTEYKLATVKGTFGSDVEFESTSGQTGTTGVQEYFVSVSGDTTFAASKTTAKVFVNGIRVDMVEECFFSDSATGSKRVKPLAGDKLFFDVTALGYHIEVSDLIHVSYLA